MDVVFHPDAESEFLSAIEYYETRAPGLGLEFALSVYSSVRLIEAHPSAWVEIAKDVRRCLVNRFPFGILYAADQHVIFILAIMDLHREPGYWQTRKKEPGTPSAGPDT
jgi:hypothetical protein